MTANQVLEAALTELNKVNAPSLILEDYNYFINKAINQYINKAYNAYDVSQQKTDDLRVLKSTAVLTPTRQTIYPDVSGSPLVSNSPLFKATYEVFLPDDYLHILSCLVEYKVQKNYKCYNANTYLQFGAKRLTADMFSQIINNYYLRPKYDNPYYFINNVGSDFEYPINDIPTLIETGGTINEYYLINFGTPGTTNLTIVKNGITTILTYSAIVSTSTQFSDINTLKIALNNIGIQSNVVGTNLLIDNAYSSGITSVSSTGTYITISTGTITDNTSLIQRVENYRYGNRSKVRMEIRFGKDDNVFQPTRIYIDYLRSPQYIRLTQEQVDAVEDTSQILEFPDYVVQEIINELVKLLMENASDPRLQTNIPVNQTIANPAQEQPRKR